MMLINLDLGYLFFIENFLLFYNHKSPTFLLRTLSSILATWWFSIEIVFLFKTLMEVYVNIWVFLTSWGGLEMETASSSGPPYVGFFWRFFSEWLIELISTTFAIIGWRHIDDGWFYFWYFFYIIINLWVDGFISLEETIHKLWLMFFFFFFFEDIVLKKLFTIECKELIEFQ